MVTMDGRKRWDWLIELTKFHGFTHGAEIGVHRGNTTYRILKACPNLRLIAVDRWKDIDPNTKDANEIGLAGANMSAARVRFNRQPRSFRNRVTVLHGDSVAMAKKIPDSTLNFVFIDADHRYEKALADIKAWTPKVKEDGVVCGHDYNHPRFPGVTRAVHECFGDEYEEVFVDYVWYAKKEDFLL